MADHQSLAGWSMGRRCTAVLFPVQFMLPTRLCNWIRVLGESVDAVVGL